MSNFVLRAATDGDVSAISRIFTHYVLNTAITFRIDPFTPDDALASLKHARQHRLPFIVAVPEKNTSDQAHVNEDILGYIYASPYSPEKKAYQHTVLFSLYCDPSQQGKGVGKVLLDKLLEILRAPLDHLDFLPDAGSQVIPTRQVLGVMYLEDGGKNMWLQKWYERFGFKRVGYMPRVGYKFEKW